MIEEMKLLSAEWSNLIFISRILKKFTEIILTRILSLKLLLFIKIKQKLLRKSIKTVHKCNKNNIIAVLKTQNNMLFQI